MLIRVRRCGHVRGFCTEVEGRDAESQYRASLILCRKVSSRTESYCVASGAHGCCCLVARAWPLSMTNQTSCRPQLPSRFTDIWKSLTLSPPHSSLGPLPSSRFICPRPLIPLTPDPSPSWTYPLAALPPLSPAARQTSTTESTPLKALTFARNNSPSLTGALSAAITGAGSSLRTTATFQPARFGVLGLRAPLLPWPDRRRALSRKSRGCDRR